MQRLPEQLLLRQQQDSMLQRLPEQLLLQQQQDSLIQRLPEQILLQQMQKLKKDSMQDTSHDSGDAGRSASMRSECSMIR